MTSVNAANQCSANGVNAHLVVAVTGEQGGAVGGPGQRQALRVRRVLAHVNELRSELVDDRLALQVEDLDAAGGSSAQPVAGRAEDQSVDDIAGLERVEVLAVGQLPQHCDTVLAARCAQGAIRGDSNGVDVTGVSEMVGLQLALGQFPDLKARRVSDRSPNAMVTARKLCPRSANSAILVVKDLLIEH